MTATNDPLRERADDRHAAEFCELFSSRSWYLAPLTHSVIPVQSAGRTLYRLRASGPDAAGVCRRLQIAGEDCSVVT